MIATLIFVPNRNARALTAASVGLIMALLLFDAVVILFEEYWIKPRRRRRGRCAHCGYDLNSLSLEVSLKCPECGRLRM